jgi:hypothetical protein
MEVLHLKAFKGEGGHRRLVNRLQSQPLIRDEDLAREVAKHVKLEEVPSGATLISEGAADTDLFLILSGEFSSSRTGKSSPERMPASRSAKWRSSIRARADPHLRSQRPTR